MDQGMDRVLLNFSIVNHSKKGWTLVLVFSPVFCILGNTFYHFQFGLAFFSFLSTWTTWTTWILPWFSQPWGDQEPSSRNPLAPPTILLPWGPDVRYARRNTWMDILEWNVEVICAYVYQQFQLLSNMYVYVYVFVYVHAYAYMRECMCKWGHI